VAVAVSTAVILAFPVISVYKPDCYFLGSIIILIVAASSSFAIVAAPEAIVIG
jgi:hypothetical protein